MQGGDILSRVAAVNDALVGCGKTEPSRLNVRACGVNRCSPCHILQVGFVIEGSAASNVTFAKGAIAHVGFHVVCLSLK